MLNRRDLLTGLTSTTALIGVGSKSYAQSATCKSTDYETCTNLQVVLIMYDPSNPLLVAVKEGRIKLHAAAHDVHKQVLAGQIARYTERAEISIYVWNPSGSGLERLSIYDNMAGTRNRRSANLDTSKVALPFIKDEGTPHNVFKMVSVGQTVMFDFPKDYVTPETKILVCAPGLRSITPSWERQEGIWLTKGTLPSYVGQSALPLSTFFMA